MKNEVDTFMLIVYKNHNLSIIMDTTYLFLVDCFSSDISVVVKYRH